MVTVGAGVTVVAGDGIGCMHATFGRGTTISGTEVVVVAIEGFSILAGPLDAALIKGAGVGIVAGQGVGHEKAASRGVATVVGTWVEVVTDCGHTVAARTTLTDTVGGTCIAVIAGCGIVNIVAAQTGGAEVVSAWITVVAVQGSCGKALASFTLIADGAGIAVTAGLAFIGRNQRTLAAIGLADSLEAIFIETLGGRTFDGRLGVY